ncbi:MAG: MOSC N-terminal beta barrel domain-containing protein [Acidimicrobiia bacterium]|nr:MOSC N-terminal beta barrel domain-containing protein [Acidimicrobiia bacterium]
MTDATDRPLLGADAAGSVAEIHRFPVKSMQGERLEHVEVGLAGLAGDRAYAVVDAADGVVASAKRPRRWARLLEVQARYADESPSIRAPAAPVTIELPDGTTHRSDDEGIHAALSRYLGREVRLESTAGPDRRFHEVWPDIEGLAPAEFIAGTRMDGGAADEDGEAISEIALGALAPPGTFFDVATLHVLTTSTLAALAAVAPESTFDVQRYRPNVLVATVDTGFVENEWASARLSLGTDVTADGAIPTMRCVMTTLPQGDLDQDRGSLRAIASTNRLEIPGLGTWACAGIYATVTGAGALGVGDEVRVSPR